MSRRGATKSARPLRVAEEIRQAFSQILTEGVLKDPRLAVGMLTVTGVDMAPDLKSGRVFVSVFPDEVEVAEQAKQALQDGEGEVKRELAARLRLRFTPSLSFIIDGSAAQGARIEQLLREIKE